MGTMAWLLVALLAFARAASVPMSPCVYGRGTSGWSALPNANGYNEGSCLLGDAQPFLPAFYAQHYLALPDTEVFYGYPFLSAATVNGSGRCGECYEVTGDLATIVVMVVGGCLKTTSNCQGSLGGPFNGPDVPTFDVDNNIFSKFSSSSGSVPIAFRKVSCDMTGSSVGFLIRNGSNAGFLNIVPFGMTVGIDTVEVIGSLTGATKGNWTALTRATNGAFLWTGRGNVGEPWRLRMRSILGDVITFTQSLSSPYPLNVTSGGQQFPAPPPGYGGALTSGSCPWPGPDPNIFVNDFGGPYLMRWFDYGSYASGGVVYNVTSGCVTPPCIAIAPSASGAMQIGHQIGAPLSMFTNISFWVRSDVATTINVFWTGSNSARAAVIPTWTRKSVSNALLWANNVTYARLKVIQFSLTQQTTVPIYFDDIQLEGRTTTALYPVIGGLAGPPPLGTPGYTGLDPYTGLPTPLTGQLPVEPVSGYVQIVGDVSLTPGDTLTITVNPSGGGGYLNVTGCVELLGTLNISVDVAPAAGSNVTFLESPCISNNGSSYVVIKAQSSSGCKRVQGDVGFTDSTHLGVLFSETACDDSKEARLGPGAIAGITIGVVAAVGVATAALIWVFKKKGRRPPRAWSIRQH